MELVDGETLRERLRREQRLPLEDASRILSGVARGLAALHRARVAHRDLKPSNVLLAREPHDMVKLSDFGIARPMEARRESTGEASVPSALEQPVQRSHLPSSSAADPTATAEAAWPDGAGPNQPGLHGPASPQQEVTRTGMISGTPRYIAPELVLNGGRAEPAGDIFGMGVMFYELLTGQHPFDEPPVHTVANGGKPHRGPLPDSVKLHPPLARLLVRALDVSSSNRPSAREFAETLETWLGTTSS